ncbi:MAG: peptidogalycan biosysnthesis protein, partial [Myxococcaceae bacterium]
VLYGRYWGCFEEHPFLHFNVCLYAGMDEVVRRGLLRFEPGAGGEHKLVRGFTPSLTYSAHALFHRGLDRAVREFLTHERAAIQAGIPSWRAETGFKD